MESVELEINGRMNTANEDGSISWIHGCTGETVKSFGSNSNGYRIINIRGKFFRMHRIIAEAMLDDWDAALTVDHINGMRSDNRIVNLRMMTDAEQPRAHCNKRDGCTSLYRGVCLPSNSAKWKASITFNGKHQHIGCFDSEIEAARAFDRAAIGAGFHKEALNFPRHISDIIDTIIFTPTTNTDK